MTQTNETESNLAQVIEQRIKLARYDGQIDLLRELKQWANTKLAEIQEKVAADETA